MEKGGPSTSSVDGILLKKSIMNFTTKNQSEAENSDSTECSSSFDSDLSDDVESDLDSDAPVEMSNTRRKLTSGWRDLVQPIKWRCKWMELQISKLEAQYKKYVSKHEECKRISTLEEGGLVNPQHRASCEVRRKKRRRTESTIDTKTYMLNHNAFSYIEKKREHPKHIREVARQVSKNPVKIDDEFRDDDGVANEDEYDEHERMLGSIIGLQSRVAELRNRLSKVTCEQGGEFNRTDNLGSGNSSSSMSDPEDGVSRGFLIANQLLSEYKQGIALYPGSTMHGGVAGANGHITCEDDDILIDNYTVEVEVELQKQVVIHTTLQRQRPLGLKDESRHLPDPVQVVANDQAGVGATDLDKGKSMFCSDEPNRATTSTKPNNNISKKSRKRGRVQKC